MDKPVAAAPTGAKEKVEKQARQLAYDVRYKTKQALSQKSGGKMDPAQVQKAYMSQLAKSPAPPAVKSRAKQMLMGEDYKSGINKLVSDNAAAALYKVFVEHHQKDVDGKVIEHEDTTPSSEDINEEEKKYKVRVTDKKSNNSYVRMASRSKIAELRSNPNISSVEMTEYGSPTKSEKLKGKQTAKAKQGLDPVGKEDGDIDNDSDEDETDKYLAQRRKAIGKAMKKDKKEGNAFGKALKDARENGDKTFVVSGKTYKVEDYKQHENYDIGTQENTKAKLDATPGQSSDDWQQQVETMQKKNASMREALAKVWGVDEGHNPFAEKITRGTGKKGLDKSLDKLYGPKKGSKKEDKTMTGKPMTKVAVDPDMKEKKTDK